MRSGGLTTDIRYSGVRGNGRIDCGVADPSCAPAEIAEELFRRGWRKAAVFFTYVMERCK
jgi:hypothetical protein